MTVRLELSPDVQTRLEARASACGMTVEAYLQSLIERAARNEAPGAATRALFARWDEEDQTDDPAELVARQKDFEEFKASMNANRPGQRPLFP
jgi:hypothetical protein